MPTINEAPREVAAAVAKQGSKTHPLIIVAAGAVTLVSVVGLGMMTGIIPSAHSDSSTKVAAPTSKIVLPNPAAITSASAAGTVDAASLPAATAKPASSTILPPIEDKTFGQLDTRTSPPKVNPPSVAVPPVARPAAPVPPVVVARAPAPSYGNTSTATAKPTPAGPASVIESQQNNSTGTTPSAPVVVAQAAPTPSYNTPNPASPSGSIVLAPDGPGAGARAGEAAPIVCRTCGTVESITPVDQAGDASGAGAAIGGVLGAVVGHQAGKGRGRDVATVAGAVGGALLGHQLEKTNKNAAKVYDIRVRMETNTFQTIRVDVAQDVRVGDRVRIEGGKLIRG